MKKSSRGWYQDFLKMFFRNPFNCGTKPFEDDMTTTATEREATIIVELGLPFIAKKFMMSLMSLNGIQCKFYA